MKKSIIKKSVGIILSFILVLSTFAISFQAYATDDTKANIVIADVTRRYYSAQTIFNQVNQMRAESNISAVKMDKTLMEAAMKRAAELSISYNKYALDGTDDYGAGADGIVYGSCSLGFNAFLEMAITENEKSILKGGYYQSIGVGAVTVNGAKLVCILLSCRTANEVDSSIYNQGNVIIDQPTVCLKSNLENISLVYPDGHQIYCGSNCEVYLKVKNKSEDSYVSEFYALIPSECLYVSSSDTSVLSVSDGYIKAVKPGTSIVTAYLKDDLTVSATSTLKVIALKFSNCTISDIEDMKYTGKPIQPNVIITDSNGNQLVKGKDYILSYADNIAVGTATVKISGIGQYAGEEKTKYFRIVPNEDIEYRVSMDVSASEAGADETIKLTAKNNLEDTTTRYTFDYSAYGSNKWTTAQSASYDNKCSLRISVPGKYIIRVTAENSSGMSASSQSVITINSALALNVTFNAQNIVLGNYIEITAQGSGSVSPYTYTYKIKNDGDGNWIDIKTNTTDTSASYKPEKNGSYSVKVRCTSKTGYASEKLFTLNVSASSLANNSTISKTAINYGDSITITGKATGGISPYKYSFLCKHSTATSWTTLTSYGTTLTRVWKPTKSGTYSVRTKVKDSTGKEVIKDFTLTVKAALANNSTISATTITKGNSVTLTGKATGGTSPYKYSFLCKHSTATSWTTLTSYGTTLTRVWKPTKSGTYSVRTKVKDSTGKEVIKDFTLTVK